MKFIQLTGDGNYGLYALDDEGYVWRYERDNRRTCEGDYEEHARHSCQYQEVAWWERLSTHCGSHPGWPPTVKELAEREVEELLR